MKLIDADKLYKELKEYGELFYINSGMKNSPYINGLEYALREIENQPEAVNEWISTSEKPMPELETVLIVVKQKYDWEKEYEYIVDTARINEDGDLETWRDWNEGQEDEIIAWRPIPEYKV